MLCFLRSRSVGAEGPHPLRYSHFRATLTNAGLFPGGGPAGEIKRAQRFKNEGSAEGLSEGKAQVRRVQPKPCQESEWRRGQGSAELYRSFVNLPITPGIRRVL